MQAAAEGLKDALFDNKSMSALFDVMRFGLEQLTSLVNGLGGAGNILLGVFSSLGVIYSEKIGQGIGSILANLKSEYGDVSINGETEISQCELNPLVHREILQRAVELAKITYLGDANGVIQSGQRAE